MLKVAILGADQVQDQEFDYPFTRLQEEKDKIQLSVVTIGGKGFAGKYGIPYKGMTTSVNIAIDHHFDGIIIPGGWGAEILRSDMYVLELVRRIDKERGIIGAICHGPWVLCSAGVFACKNSLDRQIGDLFNANATCFPGMKDDLINAGARYVETDCCQYNHLVTSPHYRHNAIFVKTFLDILYAKSS